MLHIVKGNISDKKNKTKRNLCVEKYTCDHRQSEGNGETKYLGSVS